MGVNIKSGFDVMRLGLASQAFSQNPTLQGSIPRGHEDTFLKNSISNPNLCWSSDTDVSVT